MSKRGRYEVFSREEDENPLASLVNLFDVAMVFAVALMVAFAIQSSMTEFLTAENVTFVKNAGQPDEEYIIKEGKKITRYKSADGEKASGKGMKKLGSLYEIESGETILVTE